MSIETNEVRKIAQLARLELTDDEVTSLSADMSNILAYIAQLNELDTTGVPPLEHAAEAGETMRDDTPRPSLERERGLSVAPKVENGCFAVPKIIE